MNSWFLRNHSKSRQKNQNPDDQLTLINQHEQLGVTTQLIDHVKSFTLNTFINLRPQVQEDNNEEIGAKGNVRKDLSEWQEKHAMLVLSVVKELSQLRFRLCPGRLTEQQFWRIYFMLVKSYIAEYELHAINEAKVKLIALEEEKSPDIGVYEVEMSETKQTPTSPPQTP
ncbi:hypothetical protein ACFE04_030277 [Oxalis oulophora]